MTKTRKTQPASEPQLVRIDDIVVIQTRAKLNPEVIAQYSELIEQDSTCPLPAIVIFRDPDNGTLRCPDGHHRIEAYRAAGHTEIPAFIEDRDEEQAILHAVGANATHGLPRTNEDKRRAVQTLLEQPTWAEKSSRAIATQCGVSHVFVEKVRSEHAAAESRAGRADDAPEGGAPTGNVSSCSRTGQDGKRRTGPSPSRHRLPRRNPRRLRKTGPKCCRCPSPQDNSCHRHQVSKACPRVIR